MIQRLDEVIAAGRADSIVVFDIEADALHEVVSKGNDYLPEVSRVWCVVAVDMVTNRRRVFREGEIDAAAAYLSAADVLIGHNIIDYDIPVLRRLHGDHWRGDPLQIDTLVVSRAVWPDRGQHPFGGNSLKHWGIHLGRHKGEFNDWSRFSEEMLRYCVQDVRVSQRIALKLYQAYKTQLRGWGPSLECDLRVARIVSEQRERGWRFDADLVRETLRRLSGMSDALKADLQRAVPPKVTPPRPNARPKGYEVRSGLFGPLVFDTVGAAKRAGHRREDLVPIPPDPAVEVFNPDSRIQAVRFFKEKYGWNPSIAEGKQQPTLDEATLSKLPYPEAKKLAAYFTIRKRLAQIEDWAARAERSRDGRVHGLVNTIGAPTYRMSHSEPNMAQVPSCGKWLGRRCRRMWRADEGEVMVGVDAKALELRVLAHRLFRWDEGAYRDIVLSGDPHQALADAVGVSRSEAKTTAYLKVYGGGAALLAERLGVKTERAREILAQIDQQMPALRHLATFASTEHMTKGRIELVDGCWAVTRSDYAAVNTAIQGDGARLMKHALVLFDRTLREAGVPASFVGNIHDEWQLTCPAEDAEQVAEIGKACIRTAGRMLGMHCPMDGDARIGETWRHTH